MPDTSSARDEAGAVNTCTCWCLCFHGGSEYPPVLFGLGWKMSHKVLPRHLEHLFIPIPQVLLLQLMNAWTYYRN